MWKGSKLLVCTVMVSGPDDQKREFLWENYDCEDLDQNPKYHLSQANKLENLIHLKTQ